MADPIISRAAAKAQGLKRYFTGVPCKYGHVDKRQVGNGKCMACARVEASEWNKNNRDKRRAWDAANPEKTKAHRVKSYQKNREKILARAHEYWVTNADKIKQKYRDKLEENRAKRRASTAKYRAAFPEKVKASREAYTRNNRDKLMQIWAAYRAANREKLRDKYTAWALANPEKVKANRAAWYAANAEKARVDARAWHAANRDRSNQASAQWRQENPEKRKAWYDANPEKVRLHWVKRRVRKLGAGGSHTEHDIKRIYTMQKGKCAYCQEKVGEKYHVDHIQPLSKGGGNWPANLQILCQHCNQSKGARDPIEHARILGFLL